MRQEYGTWGLIAYGFALVTSAAALTALAIAYGAVAWFWRRPQPTEPQRLVLVKRSGT